MVEPDELGRQGGHDVAVVREPPALRHVPVKHLLPDIVPHTRRPKAPGAHVGEVEVKLEVQAAQRAQGAAHGVASDVQALGIRVQVQQLLGCAGEVGLEVAAGVEVVEACTRCGCIVQSASWVEAQGLDGCFTHVLFGLS